MILVSYCKLGLACTYKGGFNTHMPDSPFLINLFKKGLVIPVCPEVFGALSTPRDPSEISGGNGFDVIAGRAKVISNKGVEVTDNFMAGAKMSIEIARKFEIKAAVLNEYSPSCGVKYVYDGTFNRAPLEGPGVLGAMLVNSFGSQFKIFGNLEREDETFLLNLFDKR